MKAIEVSKLLLDAVARAKSEGSTAIPIESLEAYAEELHAQAEVSPEGVASSDAALENYKTRLSRHLQQDQYQREHGLEMLRSTVSTAQSALKATILINGGAAAALLAFIGGIWNDTGSAKVGLANAMSLFVVGVFASGLAQTFAYISQAGFGNEFGKHSKKFGAGARLAAMFVVLSSFGFFIAGSWHAYDAIISS